MAERTKRTYNLSPGTIAQVRELAARYGAAASQDGVVELAVERLYREHVEHQEEEEWARAADDPEFTSEMRGIARAYGDTWPA